MARQRRFNLEFKRQVVLDFLEKRMGLRELARKHNLSRNLLTSRNWHNLRPDTCLTDGVHFKYKHRSGSDRIVEIRLQLPVNSHLV